MTAILPIYEAFESTHTSLLSSPSLQPRTRHLLATLHIPALLRSARLGADLSHLLPDERTRELEQGPQLRDFLIHISHTIETRPHLLIAYTWIFYLALFAGGRYLRKELRESGIFPATSSSDDAEEENPGLTFWHFDSSANEEELKNEFKARVQGIEGSLTEDERRDVVQEAGRVMGFLGDVVGEVEAWVARGGGQAERGVEVRDGEVIGGGRSLMQLLNEAISLGIGFGRAVAGRLTFGSRGAVQGAVALA